MIRSEFVKHRRMGLRIRQRGISLLDTICAMTILGTVSATALPMVADLPGQARESVVQSMAGAVQSASDLVHMKCIVSSACGLNAGAGKISVQGGEVKVSRGYPDGGDAQGIENAVAFTGFTPVQIGLATVFQKDGARNVQACAVRYEAPVADGGAPAISTVTTGC